MHAIILNLGDWANAISELTFCQIGAYMELMRFYYREEKPIPLDYGIKKSSKKEKLAARTNEELAAIQHCLLSFFYETADGWHHMRIDKEIRKYQASTPARQQRQAVKVERSQHFNAQRYALFTVLRKAGMTGVSKATPVHELRELVERLGLLEAADALRDERLALVKQPGWLNHDLPQSTSRTVNNDLPASGQEMGEPLNLHLHIQKEVKGKDYLPNPAASEISAPPVQTAAPSAQSQDTALKTLDNRDRDRISPLSAQVVNFARSLGIKHANPRDDALLALLDTGVPVADFLMAASEARASGKGWADLLIIARNRHAHETRGRQEPHQNGHQGTNGDGLIATQPDPIAVPPSLNVTAQLEPLLSDPSAKPH